MGAEALWSGIINYSAILLGLAWVISFITTIILDNGKKNTTDKNYRIIKRAVSIFGIVLGVMFVVLIACIQNIPNYIGFIGEIIFFITAIIILWTNKKSRQ